MNFLSHFKRTPFSVTQIAIVLTNKMIYIHPKVTSTKLVGNACFLTRSNSCHTVDRNERILNAAKRTGLNATACGETSGLHKKFIDFPRALATFLNSPNNERLATTTVTSGKDTFDVGRVAIFGSCDVGTPVSLESETFGTIRWTQESHAQEDEVGREEFFRVCDFGVGPLAFLILLPIKTDSLMSIRSMTCIP